MYVKKNYWSFYLLIVKADWDKYIKTAQILKNKQFHKNYVIVLALVTMATVSLARDQYRAKWHKIINNHATFEAKFGQNILKIIWEVNEPIFNQLCLAKRLERLRVNKIIQSSLRHHSIRLL